MTGIWVTVLDQRTTTKADLGEFKAFITRTGCDKTEYVDVRTEHGVFSMELATWCNLIRRSQEAIVAAQSKLPIRNGVNLGGACYDMGAGAE